MYFCFRNNYYILSEVVFMTVVFEHCPPKKHLSIANTPQYILF